MFNKKLHLAILICFWLSHSSFSQKNFKRFSYIDGFSITPKLGIGSVVGELGDLLYFKPTYGISIEKGVSEKVNLSLNIVGGNLSGIENNPYFSRFQNEYFQVHALAAFNISRYISDSYQKKKLDFKAYCGIGWVWFHTDVFDARTGDFLRTTSDGTTKHTSFFQQAGTGIGDKGIYYTRELVIPLGVRLDGKLSKKIGLVVDFGYNWIYNDKFDGTTFYNLQYPNIIGGVNSYSDSANDGWMNFSIGIKYKFASMKFENQRGI
ncbi:MAG: hypothetical protein V4585_15260 [Bacteroidota bacterium]